VQRTHDGVAKHEQAHRIPEPSVLLELDGSVKASRQDVEIMMYKPRLPDLNPCSLKNLPIGGSAAASTSHSTTDLLDPIQVSSEQISAGLAPYRCVLTTNTFMTGKKEEYVAFVPG
jgi:hypothetical protein